MTRDPRDVATYEHLKPTGHELQISVFLKSPLTVRQFFRLTSQDHFAPRAPARKSLAGGMPRVAGEVEHIQAYILPREMLSPVRGRRLRLRSMPRFPNHPRLVQWLWLPQKAKQAYSQKRIAPQRTPLPEKPLQSRYTLG